MLDTYLRNVQNNCMLCRCATLGPCSHPNIFLACFWIPPTCLDSMFFPRAATMLVGRPSETNVQVTQSQGMVCPSLTSCSERQISVPHEGFFTPLRRYWSEQSQDRQPSPSPEQKIRCPSHSVSNIPFLIFVCWFHPTFCSISLPGTELASTTGVFGTPDS